MSRSTRADLLAFGHTLANRVAPRCGAPIAYGGLAFIAHTGDWRFGLDDIDLLVKFAKFADLLDVLGADAHLECEETRYHSIKVRRGGLKASFDSLDHYLEDVAHQPARATVGGFAFQVIDRAALIACYERGAATIAAKRASYLAKLERLRLT